MLFSSINSPPTQPACYFSITPNASAPHSSETPSTSPLIDNTPSDPTNPLLALRYGNSSSPPSLSSSPKSPGGMDASKLLQLQTAAAHSKPRPNPQPLQAAAGATSASDDSTSSTSTTASTGSTEFDTPVTRCCRCHRSSSSGSNGMVCFGTNLYYCPRCANMVGYGG